MRISGLEFRRVLFRSTRAKQFLLLHGQRSLFRQTVERTPAGPDFLPPIVLCGDGHVAMVREQMSDREEVLLVEPIPRNTAAAIALAVAQADADTLLLVMPSDHVIADVRSEEHTSELQSLMRTSYAVLCLKK